MLCCLYSLLSSHEPLCNDTLLLICQRSTASIALGQTDRFFPYLKLRALSLFTISFIYHRYFQTNRCMYFSVLLWKPTSYLASTDSYTSRNTVCLSPSVCKPHFICTSYNIHVLSRNILGEKSNCWPVYSGSSISCCIQIHDSIYSSLLPCEPSHILSGSILDANMFSDIHRYPHWTSYSQNIR